MIKGVHAMNGRMLIVKLLLSLVVMVISAIIWFGFQDKVSEVFHVISQLMSLIMFISTLHYIKRCLLFLKDKKGVKIGKYW